MSSSTLAGRLARGITPRMGAASIKDVAPVGSEMMDFGVEISSRSSSGAIVTPERALGIDAVWSCVRLLSDSIGALPLKSYRKVTGGREDFENPLLQLWPNPEMTAMDLWSLVTVHLNVYGNAYLGKVFDGARVSELWPIHPEAVIVRRVNGQKTYQIRDRAGSPSTDVFTARDVIHVKGMSLDGLMGLSPIAYHREAFGKMLAEADHGSRFYKNQAVPHGVLELDGELGDTAFQALEKRWARAHRGAKNAGKIAILEAGVKFKPLTMSNADAQYIQSRNMSAVEVARIHRVPASMIDASSGQSLTYRTVESDGIHLERYSLNPWMVRIEQALMRDHDLFPGAPDSYPQFLRQALLRSDSKTRAEFYAKALDPLRGWMDRAEVREAEDLPPETVTQTPTQVRKSMAALLPAGKGGHD